VVCFHLGTSVHPEGVFSVPRGMWNVFMIFGGCRCSSRTPPGDGGPETSARWSQSCSSSRGNSLLLRQHVSIQGIVSCPACAITQANWDNHAVVHQRSANEKIGRGIDPWRSRAAAGPAGQRFYGSTGRRTDPDLHGLCVRGFNTHGRARFTLAHRARAGQNEERLRNHRPASASAAAIG